MKTVCGVSYFFFTHTLQTLPANTANVEEKKHKQVLLLYHREDFQNDTVCRFVVSKKRYSAEVQPFAEDMQMERQGE